MNIDEYPSILHYEKHDEPLFSSIFTEPGNSCWWLTVASPKKFDSHQGLLQRLYRDAHLFQGLVAEAEGSKGGDVVPPFHDGYPLVMSK